MNATSAPEHHIGVIGGSGLYAMDALTAVRTRGDLAHWIKFFLVAIDETARKGVQTFQAIHRLRQRAAAQVQALGKRTANASRLLE